MADQGPGKCPHCGDESDGTVLYSCPPRARCQKCGETWEFGDGPSLATEEEARRVRPGFTNRAVYPWATRVERFDDEGWEFLPRSQWGDGPWQEEPDLIEWRLHALPGYVLLIRRAGMSSLCGYVGLPEGHPLHGKRVRGCNWAGPTDDDRKATGELPTHWWLGFDCGHGRDYIPVLEAKCGRAIPWPDNYVTVAQCKERVEDLATVFKVAENPTRLRDVLTEPDDEVARQILVELGVRPA